MNRDIRLSVSFFNHPKTIMLNARFGPQGLNALIRLWCFAGEWKQSGDLSSMLPEEIAIASGWHSDANLFISGLIECKFLDPDMKLHDWKEHNPYAFYAPERSNKARISALYKHGKKKEAERLRKACGFDAKRMRNAEKPHANRCAPSPSPSPSPSPKYNSIPFKEVIDYLNSKTGKNFNPSSKATREHISGRWSEGATLEDFKKCIDNMVTEWKDDPKMCQFLRPSTLFNSEKFDGYVNRIVSKKNTEGKFA